MRTTIFVCVAMTSFGVAAAASDSKPTPRAKPRAAKTFTINRTDDPSTKLFEMGPDACLRGPMNFYDQDGEPMLILEAGKYQPAGCDKK